MMSVSRTVSLALALTLSACSGPRAGELGDGSQPQRTSSEPVDVAAPEVASAPEAPVMPIQPAESSLDSAAGLAGLPLTPTDEMGEVAAEPEVMAGDAVANGPDEPASLFHFVPFEAPGALDPAVFARWSAALHERFLGDPDEARQAELQKHLEGAHIVDLTPAYINLVDGLDMANPDHVARAGELTLEWFLTQEKYKQSSMDRNVEDMRSVTVGSRVTALKAWVRWWQRTLSNETVERYRSRVDVLTAKLEAMRKERRQDQR
ncbi:MAG: hypothetical protein ACI9EF_002849 [Pseudohongiellaceae bacterium]|jgi:hypothetical protein